MSETLEFNIKGLESILKALKGEMPTARVGILGSKTNRNKNTVTNATVGAAHEFGTDKLPVRSFLRVPITEHLQGEIEKSGALDKEALAEVVRSGSVKIWLEKITGLAENIVLGAFSSGGYGKWPAWKTPGYENNTGQILVDTQQLRNSITSEVK